LALAQPVGEGLATRSHRRVAGGPSHAPVGVGRTPRGGLSRPGRIAHALPATPDPPSDRAGAPPREVGSGRPAQRAPRRHRDVTRGAHRAWRLTRPPPGRTSAAGCVLRPISDTTSRGRLSPVGEPACLRGSALGEDAPDRTGTGGSANRDGRGPRRRRDPRPQVRPALDLTGDPAADRFPSGTVHGQPGRLDSSRSLGGVGAQALPRS
jgi:hypothetical protein